MERNKERFVFLKWGAQAFKGLTIVPPGAGIVHQVSTFRPKVEIWSNPTKKKKKKLPYLKMCALPLRYICLHHIFVNIFITTL